MSEIADLWRRGRPVVRWKDRVKKYIHGRGGERRGEVEQARRGGSVLIGRGGGGGGSSAVVIPLEDVSKMTRRQKL